LTKPVGSTFQYSNANYAILGLVVQIVSGVPYQTYIQEHILTPLQMQQSFVSQKQARQAGLAQGHQSWFGFPVPIDLPVHESAFAVGYLMSSAEDMSHYLIAQSNGGRYNGISLLSPQGIDTMHAFAPGFSYAMGWGTVSQSGERVLYHDGDTLDSHSEMFIAPLHHWGIVLLLNEGDGIGYALSFTIHRMAIGQQILRLLEGQALAPAGWSTNTYYLIIDGVLAIIFALVLANFLRLPHWYKRFEQLSRYCLVRMSMRLIGELLLPTLILLGLPALGGYSWPFILRVVPDLGWWILVTMSLLLITGMLRGVLVLRTLRQKNVVPLKGVPFPSALYE